MMSRLINAVAARIGEILVVAFALTATIASFSASNAEAYLFPRLISASTLVLCVFLLRESFSKTPMAANITLIGRVAPSFAVIAGYATIAETVGFYLAGATAFFLIVNLYGGESRSPKQLTFRIIVTATFILAMYLIFSLLLKVQVPKGSWL